MAEDDAYNDVAVENAESRPRRRLPSVFSLLSALVGVLILATCLCTVAVYVDPTGPLNPFPPPTITGTPTTMPPPTVTARPPTRVPSATPTLEAPEATATTPPTPTEAGTPTPTPQRRWVADIVPKQQFLPGRTCADRSFAGEVRDVEGNPLTGYTVRLKGNDGFERTVEVGSQPGYGPAGWEVMLVDDQGAPLPVSVGYSAYLLDAKLAQVTSTEPYEITIGDNCEENMIYIVFRQE